MPGLKQRLSDFVGYDEQVAQTASTTEALGALTHNLPSKAATYAKNLFPFHRWILNYNLSWLYGDVVAGITVGLVLVPQGMSYAKIATLPVQYGLYSSFVGVMVYAFFATSKDVSIGPVAVMSLQVSKVIAHVQGQAGGAAYAPQVIATALAFICGFAVLGIGLLRLGWLVEFIPAPAVAGFMTGSALNIAAGQVPNLMGYSSLFNTRAATYEVIINSLKHLPNTQRDAAFGLSGLFFLYAVRYICNRIERRSSNRIVKRIAFFLATLRTFFVILMLTIFSWVYLRHKKASKFPISVLKTVPSGFQAMGTPKDINSDLMSRLGSEIPVSIIILLLEHIAISKSFGRVNGYKIDPNQELIAIGVTNTIGTLFNAYPATGSFSRTAIKSKAGVRTPLAGWFSGIVVIIAIYALTGAFYWIPNAALAAVIIHAVGDLIASPRQVYGFWKISPLECLIFFAAVFVSVFSSIENGVYTAVAASAALLLYRIARPRGKFLGRVRIHHDASSDADKAQHRDVYVPLNPDGIRNPNVAVEAPPPGVIIYRFEEAFLYLNAAYYTDVVLDYAKLHTKSGQDFDGVPQGDRPWNDPGPNRWTKHKDSDTEAREVQASKPILRAVVFDFSSVSNIDTTSVQNLIDLRVGLERYSDHKVEFHFATILSPWIKRALLAGGFGSALECATATQRPIEVAAVTGTTEPDALFPRRLPLSPPTSPQNGRTDVESGEDKSRDVERGSSASAGSLDVKGRDWESEAPVVSPLHTNFHIDLNSAVAAATGGRW